MASKAGTKPSYKCSECGWAAIKWVGRCGECQAWGTVSEVGAVSVRTAPAAVVERPALPIGDIDVRRAQARSTGVGEFDRVLGGGIVPGAVVLVAGEPGIGKSTLLLDVAARAAREGATVLYVSGEESAAQVRVRAERIEAMAKSLYLASETDLATVLAQVQRLEPDLGIVDLPDPSGLFLSSRTLVVPGTCVTVTLEGRRPLVAEVQSLVAPTQIPTPRRATSGLDSSRVAMILAVLDRRAGVPLRQADTYLSTVGGVRLSEPAADLAVALALASAVQDRPLPQGTVAFGEVGLAGEIRPVTGIPRRLAEAARLGFRKAFVPPGVLGSGTMPDGLNVVEVSDIFSAVQTAA